MFVGIVMTFGQRLSNIIVACSSMARVCELCLGSKQITNLNDDGYIFGCPVCTYDDHKPEDVDDRRQRLNAEENDLVSTVRTWNLVARYYISGAAPSNSN